MPLLKLNSLGAQNINFDLEPCDLPVNTLTYGTNYKLLNGKIRATNMSYTLATPSANFKAGLIMPVLGDSGNFYLLLGQNNPSGTQVAWAYNGTTWTDISQVGAYTGIDVGDELLWTGCLLGNIPIVNNVQDYPAYWSPQQIAQKLQPLLFKTGQTFQAKGLSAKVVRAHKNFLFAINLQESGVVQSTSYRWSHPADINGLPPSWDETNLSFIAGIASVGGDMGDLVDGMTLRDNFILYSQRGISVLSYVGGEFVWARNVLTTSYGLLAKNCIVESKGYHYFLTDGDILKTDGNSIVSVLHNQMQTQLVGNIDATNYMNSFAFSNPVTEEIWFCIPQTGNTLPNIAFVISTADDLVSMRAIPSTTGINFGPTLQVPILWSNVLGDWNQVANNWTYDPTSIFSRTIVSTNNVNSAIISLELDDATTTQNTILERTSFPVEGQEVVITTQSVFPHIVSQAPVLIQLGSQQFVAGPISWKAPVSFDPNTMRKVDIRTTGKLLSWRIYSTGTLPFTLTGLDIQYVVNGVR
jgi:hypothetical protein